MKVKHYQDIIHRYDETGDKKLLKKTHYGLGYIDGATSGKSTPQHGSLANHYQCGFEAGVKDRAKQDKKQNNRDWF